MSVAESPHADLSQLAGLGETFEHGGKAYSLRELTFEQGAKFSQWVKDRAKAEAARSEALPPEFVQRMISVVSADIAAGHYDWGGPVCANAMFSPEGAAYALWLCLAGGGEPIDLDDCRKMVREKLDKIADWLAREEALPKDSSGQAASSPLGPTSSRGSSGRRASRKPKRSK